MSHSPDYWFNGLSRIGSDHEEHGQQAAQNDAASSYMLTMTAPQCPAPSPMTFALSQPFMNFSGTHHVAPGGSNIDASTEVLFRETARDEGKTCLWQRPFATVPYLGRGKSDTDAESALRAGYQDSVVARPSVAQLSEVSYENYARTPMLPSLQASITNPAHLVEAVADSRWVRGGIPSRDHERDREYD